MKVLSNQIHNYHKRKRLGFLLYGLIGGFVLGIVICKVHIL